MATEKDKPDAAKSVKAAPPSKKPDAGAVLAVPEVPEPTAPDVVLDVIPDVVLNVTPKGAADGLIRCARCGASEVSYNATKGMLFCAFCRYEWAEERLDEQMKLSEGIGELKGTVMSTSAVDITDDGTLVTIKCTGCGAEVVIDTDHNLQARCHWCKHTLSLNNTMPNGAVPDGILPFGVTRQQAMQAIGAFVDARKSFALPAFSETFKLENIMGVYMPYMTVDGNIVARLDGIGEVQTGTKKVSDTRTDYYADEFTVTRHLTLEIDDLIVETSSDKVDIHSNTSTNNVINAVLPFDVKNVVRFNSGFLGSEYTSERRDMDVSQAEGYASGHFMTIARSDAQKSVSQYGRGVRWESEQVNIKGSRWTAILLPVWLYGFVETKKGKQVVHYIAVNGRNGATMGSVPINTGKAARLAWGLAAGISIITWPIAFVLLLVGG